MRWRREWKKIEGEWETHPTGPLLIPPRGKDTGIAEPSSPLREGLGEALNKLMHYREEDGRYLVRYRYQWWAIYHVLVRRCGFPEGYHDFARHIAQLFPEGLRVPCMVSTLKQLSQTRYMQPLDIWRYDALYHGSPERYRFMERTVRVLGEMVNETIRNGCPGEPT